MQISYFHSKVTQGIMLFCGALLIIFVFMISHRIGKLEEEITYNKEQTQAMLLGQLTPLARDSN